MRALIIDDVRVIRRVLRASLELLGFAVSEAGDGCEGLASLRRDGLPDVVLVDGTMPIMGGIEFLRQVRADVELSAVPVVLVTGEGDDAYARHVRELGADDCIVKPVTKDTLHRTLTRLGLLCPAVA